MTDFSLRLAAMTLAAAVFCGAAPAQAASVSRSGDAVRLDGPIKPGDEFTFRNFLRDNPGVKIVMLDSPGGFILPAKEIARDIRKNRLDTGVDAGRASCNSACTGIFAGGVNRYYLNTQGLADGDAKKRGLGFHQGNAFNAAGVRAQSGPATADMINIYYEMGASGAVNFVTKADWKSLHRISGATAMQHGIATSLTRR